MSSMRNAVQRRNHKERAQPREREKWGLLEKHKDYSLRARDYNAKKARLAILRSKAVERNPDEFHYGMLSSQSKTGRKLVDRGNPVLSHEAVKLLKTQDSGYLQTMIQQTRRAIEKLEEEFILNRTDNGVDIRVLGQGKLPGKKTIFVDDEQDQRSQPGSSDSEQIPEEMDLDESSLQPPKSQKQLEKEKQERQQDKQAMKKLKKEQDSRRAKLAALKTREKDLWDAENELEVQRAKMNNAVGGVNRNGVKFKIAGRKK